MPQCRPLMQPQCSLPREGLSDPVSSPRFLIMCTARAFMALRCYESSASHHQDIAVAHYEESAMGRSADAWSLVTALNRSRRESALQGSKHWESCQRRRATVEWRRLCATARQARKRPKVKPHDADCVACQQWASQLADVEKGLEGKQQVIDAMRGEADQNRANLKAAESDSNRYRERANALQDELDAMNAAAAGFENLHLRVTLDGEVASYASLQHPMLADLASALGVLLEQAIPCTHAPCPRESRVAHNGLSGGHNIRLALHSRWNSSCILGGECCVVQV